ncbi:MAG: hypothetical protein IT343_12055 [Candidatus Melainabacteria bacterium]|jgi:hypothetical protein|nr:hypothetical protein [Candidatus Melainabacteria bacterium]
METQVEKINSVRRVLADLVTRINESEASAQSREWPHASLTGVVRAYVVSQAAIARSLVHSIAQQLGFPGPDAIAQSVEGSTVTRFIGGTMMLAQASGVSADEAQKAAFATIDEQKKRAVELVRHVEAVVEGEETIEGRQIQHGPLHYK